MLSSLMNSCSILTMQLTYNSMLSSLPAAAATAVAQRSQGGKQAKSIPLVKCTQKKRPSRNACAGVQNSKSVHSVCTAVSAFFLCTRPCQLFCRYGRASFFSCTAVARFFPVRPFILFSCTAVSRVCTHTQPPGFYNNKY